MSVDGVVTVSAAGSSRSLTAWVRLVGEDVVVAVGGGERPHVGCVVLAVPVPSTLKPGRWSASCSVLTIPPHKEEPIARGVAVRLAQELGRVAVVTAGVHDDAIDRVGIEEYLALGQQLSEDLVKRLR